MKYGVVYFKETDNIGDDIQCYAAIQYLPRVDYLIEREELGHFKSQDDEPVATIMNGWFMHKKYNWPPADCIVPLCIAMHFTPNDRMGIGYHFLDDEGGAYLKAYEPVGCRDESTKKALDSRQIKTYRSECLTMTIPTRTKKKTEQEYICGVDISKQAETKLREYAEKNGLKYFSCTHWVDYKKDVLTWEERLQAVEKLLDLYQNAKFIVTSRLHCALPSLAMGTRVLLLYDEEKEDASRFSSFTAYLNVMTEDEFCAEVGSNYLENTPDNPETFRDEQATLRKTAADFVQKMEQCPADKAGEMVKYHLSNEVRTARERTMLEAALTTSVAQTENLLRENEVLRIEKNSEIEELNGRHVAATEKMQAWQAQQAQEIERLGRVIESNENEMQRLNDVIVAKNKEEERLNNVISERNQELASVREKLNKRLWPWEKI